MCMKNKAGALLPASLLLMILCSCTEGKETDYSQLPDTIQLKAEPGMVRAVMDERVRIHSEL